MTITYSISTVTDVGALVEFKNEIGEVYTRYVNVPKHISNDVTHPDFLKILEDHKRAVEYRSNIGLISFVSKNNDI